MINNEDRSPDSGLRQRIFAEQVSLLYSQYSVPAFTGILVTFVVAYVLGKYVPAKLLIGWLILQNTFLAYGYYLVREYSRSSKKSDSSSWYKKYLIAISLIGIMWGALAGFLNFNLSLFHQIFLIIVAVGAACSALLLAISVSQTYYLFLGLCLSPTIVWLLAQYPNPLYIIGINGVLFIGLLLFAGRSLNRHMVNTIQLNFVNADLADEVNKLNENLESRVQIKTHELYQSEERFNLAMQGANDGLWDWNITDHTVYFSPRWFAMLGYMENELIGLPREWRMRIHPVDRRSVLRKMKDHLHGLTSSYESVHRFKCKDGNYIWVLDRGRAVFDRNGIPYRMVGTQVDLTDQKKLEEKLKSANLKLKHEAKERMIAQSELAHLAKHDPLTGLPNRLYFYEQLQEAIRFAETNGDAIAVLLVDLDNFKNVNDTLGHPVGDRLLEDVSKRLTSIVNKNYFLSRFGGDEFLVILRDCSDTFLIDAYAREIIELLSRPFFFDNHEIRIGCSIGITMFPDHGKEPNKLIRDADIAMYYAKERGKNTYNYFTEEMDHQIAEKVQMRNLLHGALERNEFIVYYQPQVDVQAGTITGLEALLRWNTKEFGAPSPDKFIPLLEDAGLIVEVGEWVMREACSVAIGLQKSGLEDLKIAVNVSPQQIQNPGFVKSVESVLTDTGLREQSLELEITENIFLENMESVHDSLMALSQMGIQIILDDFGTGCSSLAYLKQFPISGLKIDKVFVGDVTRNNDSRQLVTAIVAMTHGLNLKTLVAEGVENIDQLEIIRSAGCPTYQGYHYSKPLPKQDLIRLIQPPNRLKSV